MLHVSPPHRHDYRRGKYHMHVVVMATVTYLSWLLVGSGSESAFEVMWSAEKSGGWIT